MSVRIADTRDTYHGTCRCADYAGGRRTPHLYGIDGCKHHAAANTGPAQDDDLPLGYVPSAFDGRDR